MIIIASLLAGVIIGATTARRRNGNRLDMLQYAAGYGIAFTIVGVFASIAIDRLAG